MGTTTVKEITWETLDAIWYCLRSVYMRVPVQSEWKTVVKDFWEIWNFPNCLGAIDGKRVMIQAPPNSGSINFNYKGFFSVVLLGTCDAHYRFTTVYIGGYGRQSDGGIFANSSLGKRLDKGYLPIPGDLTLKGTNISQPCAFVGDDAFGLSTYMMRPYPGKFRRVNKNRIFNYRLSRARRIIENVLGILASRFRIFKRPIACHPENTIKIIKATVVLHNFLRTDEINQPDADRIYCPSNYVDQNDEDNGEWRLEPSSNALKNLDSNKCHNFSKTSSQMRENLADFFVNCGSVPWQNERAALFLQD